MTTELACDDLFVGVRVNAMISSRQQQDYNNLIVFSNYE